jgi:hypothetical protein
MGDGNVTRVKRSLLRSVFFSVGQDTVLVRDDFVKAVD